MPVVPLVANYSNIINACNSFNTQVLINNIINDNKPITKSFDIDLFLYALANFVSANIYTSLDEGVYAKPTRIGRESKYIKPITALNQQIAKHNIKISVPFYHKTFVKKENKTTTTFLYRVFPTLEPRWWGENTRYQPTYAKLSYFDPSSGKVWLETAGSPPKRFVCDFVFLNSYDQEYIKKNLEAKPDDQCEYLFSPEKNENIEDINIEDLNFTISGKSIIKIKYSLNTNILSEMLTKFMHSEYSAIGNSAYIEWFNPNDPIYTQGAGFRTKPKDWVFKMRENPLRFKLKDKNIDPFSYFTELYNEYITDPRLYNYTIENSSNLDIKYDQGHSHNDYAIWKKNTLNLLAKDSIIKDTITYRNVTNQYHPINYNKKCTDDCGRITETNGKAYIEQINDVTIKILDYKEDPKNRYGIECTKVMKEPNE